MATRAFFKQLVKTTRSEAHTIAKGIKQRYLTDEKKITKYVINKCKAGFNIYFYEAKPRKIRSDKGKTHKQYKPRTKPTIRRKIGKYEHSAEFKAKQADPNKPKSNAGRPPKFLIRQRLTLDTILDFMNTNRKVKMTKAELIDLVLDEAIAQNGIDPKHKKNLTINPGTIELCTPINSVGDIKGLKVHKLKHKPKISETDKNLFFRGGSPKHVFEYGQTQVPEWKDKSELQVLAERVNNGLKPFATFVIQEGDGSKEKAYLEKFEDLAVVLKRNKWDVLVVRFCLKENLKTRLNHFRLDAEFEGKTFEHYLENGCDTSAGDSYEECGVLYGYC